MGISQEVSSSHTPQVLLRQSVIEVSKTTYAGILPACVRPATTFYARKSASALSFWVILLVEDGTNDFLPSALGTCFSPNLVLGNGIEALLVNIDSVTEPGKFLPKRLLCPRAISLNGTLGCPF
jgi:hypothetical protein